MTPFSPPSSSPFFFFFFPLQLIMFNMHSVCKFLVVFPITIPRRPWSSIIIVEPEVRVYKVVLRKICNPIGSMPEWLRVSGVR